MFSRYETVNETAINSEKVKSIVGYDANALCLSAKHANWPLTLYVCNRDNQLVSEKSNFLQTERQYIAFISKHHHDQNSNSSVTTSFISLLHRVFTHAPDAICVSCKTFWEFLGCYHHTHACMSLVS